MFYGSRHEKFDEAHRLNLQAIILDPDNLNYRLNTATVLLQAQNYTSALSVLQSAAKLARTPSEVELVNIRIDQIEKYQTTLKLEQQGSTKAEGNAPEVAAAHVPAAPARPIVLTNFKYPTGPPSGPHHTVHGIIRNVQCFCPSVITLDVEDSGKTVILYNNDLFHIPFTAANYTPDGELHPCTGIEGMKARIEYGEVSDKTVGGQILSVMLSK